MAHDLTLDGRTAIVTGAANGLGRAEAIALAAEGAAVVLNDLPGPAVQAVADEITGQAGGPSSARATSASGRPARRCWPRPSTRSAASTSW